MKFFCWEPVIFEKTPGVDKWGDTKEEKAQRKAAKEAKKQAQREERVKARDPNATRLEIGDRELFKFRPKKKSNALEKRKEKDDNDQVEVITAKPKR